MPITAVIDALRTLAPVCPGGEAVLLEAAEHLRQMLQRVAELDPTSQLPLPDPTR